jgi:hypothetical protein
VDMAADEGEVVPATESAAIAGIGRIVVLKSLRWMNVSRH